MTKPSLNQSTENADLSTLTPAMRQFIEIRTEVAKQHPNILLLYRMGDFYETFFEDAVEINRLLSRAAERVSRMPFRWRASPL